MYFILYIILLTICKMREAGGAKRQIFLPSVAISAFVCYNTKSNRCGGDRDIRKMACAGYGA